jgi:hypothetical protein
MSMSLQVGESVREDVAHVDESGVRLADGARLVGLVAVLTRSFAQPDIVGPLRDLVLPGRDFLHYYDETPTRRVQIAGIVATLPLSGALIITKITNDQQQERARARLLTTLLPRLQHVEHVSRVIIESRGGSDKHDRRTRDRLRHSRSITAAIQVDHAQKQDDERLWLPDFIAGSYVGAVSDAGSEPWKIVSESHLIEVISMDSE